jgi:tRNA modification GTPase
VTDGDTIGAIATPPGAGGVGIVRVSGPAAAAIARAVTGVGELEDRRLVRAVARDPRSGERLDDVLVVLMRAPRTFTGEDVLEVHGHGGQRNMGRLLRACLEAGARAAEPGEFTRRAFVLGRIDLTQAEAVAGVIGAASERALRVAQAGLAGGLSERVSALRGRVVELLSEVEAGVDFPEEDLDLLSPAEVAGRAGEVGLALRALAGTYAVGRALKEGVEVALTGPPNVGKSSLLNALAGEERAIVAPEPGTTRDFVEARVVWSGVPVTLIDTAGDRDAEGALEQRGVELGRARAARADLVVWVRDATARGPGRLDQGAPPPGDTTLEVWNKVDLAAAPDGALAVSALEGRGLEGLRQAVLERVLGGADSGTEDAVVSSERQRALVEAAGRAAERARELASTGRPVELVALELREAAPALGRITGEEVSEDVLDRLFARFCIGK